MLNEQKAYINKLINLYDRQAKLCLEEAEQAWEEYDSTTCNSYIEKARIYNKMKSDLKKFLEMEDNNA